MYVATDTDDIIMTSLLQKIEAKMLLLKIHVLFSYLGHADIECIENLRISGNAAL